MLDKAGLLFWHFTVMLPGRSALLACTCVHSCTLPESYPASLPNMRLHQNQAQIHQQEQPILLPFSISIHNVQYLNDLQAAFEITSRKTFSVSIKIYLKIQIQYLNGSKQKSRPHLTQRREYQYIPKCGLWFVNLINC